jgi:hypothetical protein
MVGGVDGMLVEESEGMLVEAGGFTELSGAGVAVVVVVVVDVVAEVSADVPVEAEPAHQSLLARSLGEAFR